MLKHIFSFFDLLHAHLPEYVTDRVLHRSHLECTSGQDGTVANS